MERKKIVIPTIFALILLTLLIVFGSAPKTSYHIPASIDARR